MFCDARYAAEGKVLESDVCIVGGGVAGLTLALQLDGKPLRVCVVESGGLSRDEATQDLYRGDNAGMAYAGLDTVRSRYLGGSSNCWGGWCRPLDEWDFERRDWVPFSGWPFGKHELRDYYPRAHQMLRLGSYDYEPDHWAEQVAKLADSRLALDAQRFTTLLNQFSPPVRFGRDYHRQLQRSSNVQVWLHANACEVRTDHAGRQVTQIRLRTLNGGELSARGRCFVLAAGGIENARLLLLSHHQQAAGLGNQHDLVGRFFMEHPRVRAGSVRLAAPNAARCYDVKYNYHSRRMRADGVSIAAHLAPTRQLQAAQRLLNARLYFASVFPGENSPVMSGLRALLEVAPRSGPSGVLLRKIHALLNSGYTRIPWPESLVTRRQLEIVIEPAPNPQSRITLTQQRDALRLNRVQLDWRIGALERSTLQRLPQLLAAEFAAHGVGAIDLTDADDIATQAQIGWCWHHMGTTRMHDDPRQGVVDRHCRVHGMSNLYIAGSSVFPTAGSDMPTITLTALACRLADRLMQQLLAA